MLITNFYTGPFEKKNICSRKYDFSYNLDLHADTVQKKYLNKLAEIFSVKECQI